MFRAPLLRRSALGTCARGGRELIQPHPVNERVLHRDGMNPRWIREREAKRQCAAYVLAGQAYLAIVVREPRDIRPRREDVMDSCWEAVVSFLFGCVGTRMS